MMKMIVCILQNDDARSVMKTLVKEDISVTRLSSTGGFLHGGNATLLIGVDESKLDLALSIIKEKSSRRQEYTVMPTGFHGLDETTHIPVQVTLGGATIFVLNVEQWLKV